MNALAQDLRFALRTLWKAPAFAAVAMLALALGIGANSAIFTVVNSVLLHPLPFPQPEQICQIYTDRFGDSVVMDDRSFSASMLPKTCSAVRSASPATMAAQPASRWPSTGCAR